MIIFTEHPNNFLIAQYTDKLHSAVGGPGSPNRPFDPSKLKSAFPMQIAIVFAVATR